MSEQGNGNGAVVTAAAPPLGAIGQPEAFGRVEATEPTTPPPAKRSSKPVVLLILGIALAVGIVVGVIWWLDARQYESTDDAFIAADVTQVSPRVAGHVQTVYVSDNQFVKAGDKTHGSRSQKTSNPRSIKARRRSILPRRRCSRLRMMPPAWPQMSAKPKLPNWLLKQKPRRCVANGIVLKS